VSRVGVSMSCDLMVSIVAAQRLDAGFEALERVIQCLRRDFKVSRVEKRGPWRKSACEDHVCYRATIPPEGCCGVFGLKPTHRKFCVGTALTQEMGATRGGRNMQLYTTHVRHDLMGWWRAGHSFLLSEGDSVLLLLLSL
jgi:hypothetical protein